MLYLARQWLDRITVLHADAGASYPHVRRFVEKTCDDLGVKLEVVSPVISVEEYTEKFGLPSDIVPVWVDSANRAYLRDEPEQMLQSPFQCCRAMLWNPMAKFIRDSGATLVLRAAKAADAHRGVPPGHVEDGVTYDSPVWNWTDEDVFTYLEREGVELPEHYKYHPIDSLDCWCCTAYSGDGVMASRMKYTREKYPELWPDLAYRQAVVRRTVKVQMERVIADFNGGLDAE